MGRPPRDARDGVVYHVINRANARTIIFEKPDDYLAAGTILQVAVGRIDMWLVAHCIMPNRWHLVVWSRRHLDLSRFTSWLALTHTQRWHAHGYRAEAEHVYQGRFKSFTVKNAEHLLALCRYVEHNVLCADLVQQAEQWRWSRLWRTYLGSKAEQSLPSAWPEKRLAGWPKQVYQPLPADNLTTIRRCTERGNPYGDERWTVKTIRQLGRGCTLRPRGRPGTQQKGP